MHDIIVLALPIAWTIVAVVVALLLYKSSSGWLEGGRLFGLPINSIRLGGSVVIFFVAFLLLKNATPPENLAIDRRDKAVVDRAHLQIMDERSGRIEDLVVNLKACLEAQSSGESCDSSLADLRRETEQLRREFTGFRPVPVAAPPEQTQ